ncbi:hydrogenase maturation nickel metallochaperone HypA [Streptomyces sp. NPDC059740]|uniref:hydrogenase maturation nickel metallochaperone HypA/HybF n=1 Tax=Streptomyces sp. NPDC059740 TaxID=3346926 RepID=UPI003647459F
MHEMSIAVAVVEQVEEAAVAAGADSVASVALRVGELAGVVADSLHFCFELACAGTRLAGAELTVETVPGRARCGRGHEWAVGMPPTLVCPRCGGSDVELLAGRELQIDRVCWREPVFADQGPTSSEES